MDLYEYQARDLFEKYEVPVLAGSELNDDPLAPISVPGQRLVAEAGDDAPVEWLMAERTLEDISDSDRERFGLASPRFTIASALGNYNFPVGATLEVGANQTPGDYSGTFTITLNYL